MAVQKAQIKKLLEPLQKCVFDANMYDLGLADYPHAVNSSKFRRKYVEKLEKMGVRVPDSLKHEPL